MTNTPMALNTPNIERAMKFGQNRAKVKARVLGSVSLLRDELIATFRAGAYDPTTKRLTSACGRYALEWRLRRYPDRPESYDNQQTSGGSVFFLTLTEG